MTGELFKQNTTDLHVIRNYFPCDKIEDISLQFSFHAHEIFPRVFKISFCLYACVQFCTCVCHINGGTGRGQKRALDPPQPES